MTDKAETQLVSSIVSKAPNKQTPTTPQPRPQTILAGKYSTITETATAIYEAEKDLGELYLTGGAVSMINKTDDRPYIQPLAPTAAQSRFEKNISLVQIAKEGPVNGILTDKMAAAILAAECRSILPKLHTIVEWPFLVVRDGKLESLSPGYNPREGIYVASTQSVEIMSVEEAVQLLKDELLGEFSFLRPSDQSRAIAAILTPALSIGRLIKGFIAPTVFEATHSQTGKGTCVRCIEGVNGEPGTYINQRKGGVGSLDESIDGALVEGRPIIVLDNLRGSLNSPALESILTKDRHKARTPYKSFVNVDTSRFCLFITSNGADFTPDMANRISVVRMRKLQNHKFRGDPEGLIDRHAAANVPRFLGAIHAVIKAWFEAGRPQTKETRHTFLAWCQSLDWIVQNIFGFAPLMDDHEAVRDRLCRPGLGFLRLLSVAVERAEKLGEDLRAQELFNIAEEHQVDIPNANRAVYDDDSKGARIVGRVMARAFGDAMEVKLEEYRVTREQMDATEICHHPTRIYRFERVEDPNWPPPSPQLDRGKSDGAKDHTPPGVSEDETITLTQ